MKNQVLTREQVRELIGLGLNIDRYSSVYYESCNNPNYCAAKMEEQIFIQGNYNGGCECGHKETISTLSIGDIINILPKKVVIFKDCDLSFGDNEREIIKIISAYATTKSTSIYFLKTDMKTYIEYSTDLLMLEEPILIQIKRDDNFINILFDLLKWYIINNYVTNE